MARPRLFQPEELRALLEQGLPTGEIASRLGVNRRTVYHAVHRDGMPPLTGKRSPRVADWCPPHLWPVYRDLRHKGMSAAERRAVVEQDIARGAAGVSADVALWSELEKVPRKPRRRIGKAVKGGLRERQIQRQIVKTLRAMGIVVAHAPNGANLAGDSFARMKQSAALIADGVIVGFPDLLLISRTGALGFLEIKRPGGIVSAEQERVAALMGSRSVPVAFVSSLDDALAVVKGWGWL